MIKIIGLQLGKTYENLSSLRYGSVMIMTDQDVDGSHIKGLVINFFNNFFVSLFKYPGFLKQFITPIVKCRKKKEVVEFYSLPDFKAFIENNVGWSIKYYKGLGTSNDEEGKEYFRNIDRNSIDFSYEDEVDHTCIDLLFNKKKSDQRKDWINSCDQQVSLDYKVDQIRYKDFIDKELIHFSVYSNQRSIPSMIDGLKPGQRKIIFSCFKRKLNKEIKVAQLSGYISEHSAYHHGEMSLQATIVGMAQDFVGTNNINLLMPNGQFGSRGLGGKDSASSRYIYTTLNPITRLIFHPKDDALLQYLLDDGKKVEPKYYVPIIPMVLVNGAQGIGTGWSTSIPQYNPRDIIANLMRKLEGGQFERMVPFYKGFTGTI